MSKDIDEVVDWLRSNESLALKKIPKMNIARLADSLHDLKGMVGMEATKNSIVAQLRFLLDNNGSTDGHMLNTVLRGAPGTGKCLARDTLLLLYSGKVVAVQDVRVGDLLMGDDFQPRQVLSLCKGVDRLYRIDQSSACTYTVNASHILTLYCRTDLLYADRRYASGDLVDMPLQDYLRNYARTNDLSVAGIARTPKKTLLSDLAVTALERGEYYGFELDGNGRFLLHDGTITHNTSLGIILARIWDAVGVLQNKQQTDPLVNAPAPPSVVHQQQNQATSTTNAPSSTSATPLHPPFVTNVHRSKNVHTSLMETKQSVCDQLHRIVEQGETLVHQLQDYTQRVRSQQQQTYTDEQVHYGGAENSNKRPRQEIYAPYPQTQYAHLHNAPTNIPRSDYTYSHGPADQSNPSGSFPPPRLSMMLHYPYVKTATSAVPSEQETSLKRVRMRLDDLVAQARIAHNNMMSIIFAEKDIAHENAAPKEGVFTPAMLARSIVQQASQQQKEQQSAQDLPGGVKFRVVSRADLVAEYLGQTAPKTKKVLESMRGGVLMIDEAYSLYHGEKDSFGAECVTVLNQFMSEEPDSVVFIFAGYGDLLEETLFRANPGMARRMGWTFDIDPYTHDQLADIFTRQAAKKGWSLREDVRLAEFFREHRDTFVHFGGDTERLLFHCKLRHSKYCWKISLGNCTCEEEAETLWSEELDLLATEEDEDEVLVDVVLPDVPTLPTTVDLADMTVEDCRKKIITPLILREAFADFVANAKRKKTENLSYFL